MKKLIVILFSLFLIISNLTYCMEVPEPERLGSINEITEDEGVSTDNYKFRYKNKVLKLNNNFNHEAEKAFGDLGSSHYFHTEVLKKEAQQLLLEANAQEIEIITDDNITIQGYFLDRGSYKVLLIGQGFIDSCNVLIPFFKLFPDYDILIINYRWHSLKFLKNVFNDVLNKFIWDAQEDVIASVKYLRNKKAYDNVTGIGLCYSGLVYILTQALQSSNDKLLFDKLIIDSSYYSTEAVSNSVTQDPILYRENKHGGTPDFLQSIFSVIFTMPVNCLGGYCLGNQFRYLSTKEYLPMIYIPIMFIHGKNDLLVPFNPYFKKMYNAAYNAEYRCALITENEHTINHIKSKEAYAYLGKMFIEANDDQDFSNSVKQFCFGQ